MTARRIRRVSAGELWELDDHRLLCGDSLTDLGRLFGGKKADAVLTDPPYGLKFMGKGWDKGVPGKEFWEAISRMAKPGAMMMAFGGTRTHHRLMCAIEDAAGC